MKVPVAEDKSRRVATKEHNLHVANGIDRHKPTAIAPSSFMLPFPDDLRRKLDSRQLTIEKSLQLAIGNPFYITKIDGGLAKSGKIT